MRESSVSERSATPVPASMRMSLSRSIEVVRKCRPPIPPLHPRIRSFMERRPPLFLVENGHAGPFGWRRVSALCRHFFRVHLVESAPGVHALEVEEVDLHLIPLPGTVRPDRLVPELELVQSLLLDPGLQSHRLVYRDGLVLALHLDLVDLPERHIFHETPCGLADQTSHPVVLRPAFEARRNVHRVPHSRIGAPDLRPHVSDPNAAGVNPDADLELRPAAACEFLIQYGAFAQHVACGKHTVTRMIRIVHPGTPRRHNRVFA